MELMHVQRCVRGKAKKKQEKARKSKKSACLVQCRGESAQIALTNSGGVLEFSVFDIKMGKRLKMESISKGSYVRIVSALLMQRTIRL
jgi:hypothetical protein